MSLLDLLSVIASPELTSTERGELRSIIHRERARAEALENKPWESGLVEQRPRTREQLLAERVEDLELALKVLADILAERGLLERGSLPTRVAKLKHDLEAKEKAREEAVTQQERQRQQAKDEAPVTCARCGASVRTRDSFSSSRGPLCPSCYHDSE